MTPDSPPGSAAPVVRLWSVDHPYYCSESNFYSNECYSHWASWPEFAAERYGDDPDLNLVFRWDWKPKEYIERDDAAGRAAYDSRFDDYYRAYTLSIFYILQRKGIFTCTEVDVCRADEPAVREWLATRWDHLRLLWEIRYVDHRCRPMLFGERYGYQRALHIGPHCFRWVTP